MSPLVPQHIRGQLWTGFPGGASGKELARQCRRRKPQGRSLGWEDPLEEGLATHSNILAWRILWTEEPGGLQSMGLQRIGQLNRATTEAT